jgi:hypothetical protein
MGRTLFRIGFNNGLWWLTFTIHKTSGIFGHLENTREDFCCGIRDLPDLNDMKK